MISILFARLLYMLVKPILDRGDADIGAIGPQDAAREMLRRVRAQS